MKFVLILLIFPVLFGQAFGQNVQPVRISAGGVEFHYIEKGQGEPLILLHGGVGDYRSWDAQMEEFSRLIADFTADVISTEQKSPDRQNIERHIPTRSLNVFTQLKLTIHWSAHVRSVHRFVFALNIRKWFAR